MPLRITHYTFMCVECFVEFKSERDCYIHEIQTHQLHLTRVDHVLDGNKSTAITRNARGDLAQLRELLDDLDMPGSVRQTRALLARLLHRLPDVDADAPSDSIQRHAPRVRTDSCDVQHSFLSGMIDANGTADGDNVFEAITVLDYTDKMHMKDEVRSPATTHAPAFPARLQRRHVGRIVDRSTSGTQARDFRARNIALRRYTCDQCERACGTKWQLERHLRCHETSRITLTDGGS
jgi:hypothetical protein